MDFFKDTKKSLGLNLCEMMKIHCFILFINFIIRKKHMKIL